ncbi:MAG: type II toxin-antitoxin system RelE/ParE family toxin [Desulfobacteraceae bacterium]|nr:MAG: type II toxin-antitoxin system RelE/ParE family toxin [Desulfobacteraceae bacterium]
MKYKIYIIDDAEEDIYEIYHYVSLSDSIEKVESLIQKIYETCLKLGTLPNRGHAPPELERIGMLEYREIHFKPYRIIYQVMENVVYIHCVLDGRRDLQELLEMRLIR